MATADGAVNGLMRATESVSAQVAVDGSVPVTVRLVCQYEAERAVLNSQLGWYRRISSLVPFIGIRLFYFYREEWYL